MPNQEPEKWRDCIDPFSLPLQKVQILEILGYPHAANQVFFLKGLCNGKEGYYYLKYACHQDANLRNETEIIRQLRSPLAPVVVEYDAEAYQYALTAQIEGRRLSVILAESGAETASGYLYEYGQALAKLHSTAGSFPRAPHRRFHRIPDAGHFGELGLENVYHWLTANKPAQINECFVHGDCHYANILWKDGHISGILDFELAGMGNREFDIAWALILRPGQKFLQTEGELQEFLAGYLSIGTCDLALVRYYMVLIYARFLKFGDAWYAQFIKAWIMRNTTALEAN